MNSVARRFVPLAIFLLWAARLHAEPVTIDLTRAVVLTPAKRIGPEGKAAQMLVEEAAKRSRVRWDQATAWRAAAAPVILIGQPDGVRDLRRGQELVLPPALREGALEGYRLAALARPD